ncbi:unnamed protein product [Hydatigera taeniaeformis]|uniref:Usp domain-containing protein n=1 Tax=Hydatigena taeniaeformis TaxID=6205 RepID=A0A158RF96_HYDTA|nr:unnamed protein product [Hydatigera taeniaeformis]
MVAGRNVLFPIDASENCERAFKWYEANLRKPDDLVFFVHVIEPVYTTPAIGLAMESPPLMVDDMTRVMEESIAAGKKLGQKYMQMAKESNLDCKAFLHVDTKAGAAIVKSAVDHQADIIVIGSRGLGAIKRTFLGSFYTENLHRDDDTVIFLHVIEPNPKVNSINAAKDEDSEVLEMPSQLQKSVDSGKALGHKYLAWGREAGFDVKAFVRSDSKPGVAIMKAARELDVDHIVVGSRGLNALGRTLLGSSFRRPGDELLILAVVEPTLPMRESQNVGVGSNDPLVEAAMMGGRTVVRRFLRWAHELGLPCRGLVQLDISPGFRIVRTARERGVHTILIGPRVRVSNDFERHEFDSITEYVLRNCPNITLTVVPPSTDDRRAEKNLRIYDSINYSVTIMSVVGSEESRRVRKILFPIDDSENCSIAFKWYLNYVRLPGDFITFVHVVEPLYTSGEMRIDMENPEVRFEDVPKTVESVMNRSKALGLNYMSLAKEAGLESRAFLHVDTQPGRAILTSAKNHNVDMIVMESKGQGILSGASLSRVSDYVVHNLTVPVVIVHAEKG